ncbi:hypothetical protein [Streptomyces sp. NBC_01477]|uniref:hypothetical protein n=1 Tax=Streptomyces sp. NBC_01477 TaxID=2976015 RepID=UPI002E359E0D|nr:hypothetical protein [Streptomyces sp. NBC_01477]
MTDLIARLGRALLRRREPVSLPPEPEPTPEPVSAPDRVPGPAPLRPPPEVLRGEDVALVRPYYVAYEREQPARQRVLWVAAHGVHLRGVEVAA